MPKVMSLPKDLVILREYYSKIDFSFWGKELSYCYDQSSDLHGSDHSSAIRLYSTYLQFIEVFLLNIFTITENDLTNLFIGNKELRDKVEQLAMIQGYKDFFFENWVFGVQEKHLINNYEKKRAFYSRLYDECIQDYLSDYDLLNAYKHGFRTHSPGPVSISLTTNLNSTQALPAFGYDSSVSFLTQVENGKTKREKIFEMMTCFNWRYVGHKSHIILSMLENTKKILLANGRGVELDTPFELDENFSRYMGNYRSKTELYTIKRPPIQKRQKSFKSSKSLPHSKLSVDSRDNEPHSLPKGSR